MAARLPDLSTVAIATTYGTTKNVTVLTNAAPAKATSTAHGFTAGKLVELKSGWQGLNERIYRVGATPATDTFDLEGTDTTNLNRYPAGSSKGSVREITAFTQITQILTFETSGGEQQFATYSFLEEGFERQLPTVTSAQSITIGIADDPTLPGYIALKEAGEARAQRAIKLTLPDGSLILFNGVVSFNETPTLTKGEVMTVTATISLNGKPTRYLAAQ